uniref:Protein PHLOEM PROTEIN 2-LIKE A10 n=1 Tax=Arundo donax TaxID=35708 RepID=A0A0A8ZPC5_ARUDO
MDALAAACLCSRRRRARCLLLAAAATTAGYGLYRHHRRRLISALSLADAVSLVGSDLADFLRSDSDQVPQSLLQLSKLAASEPVSSAASSISESVSSGVLRAISSHRQLQQQQQQQQQNPQTPFQDRILDRLLSPAGAGFASAVVGSFARNLVWSCHDRTASSASRQSEPEWLTALCSARGKEATADLVRIFVSTAVTAYLDRTATVRTTDQVLAGLSDPRQEAKVKAKVKDPRQETFLRTSRQLAEEASIARAQAAAMDREVLRNSDSTCVMQRVSSTLAVPSNRRFVLDVTGRVTAETVRSFLDFLADRVSDGARKSIVVARNEVAERGLIAVKYLGAKSMAIFTITLALCMHILMGMRFLLPV